MGTKITNHTKPNQKSIKKGDNDATVKLGRMQKDAPSPHIPSKFFKNEECLDSDAKNYNKKNIKKHKIEELTFSKGNPSHPKSVTRGKVLLSLPW